MEISFLNFFTLMAVIHCFALSGVILFSKFFRSSLNRYLGFTLFLVALVGLNNWFWDMDSHPVIISVFDLFLWQFLYPVTFFMFFFRAAEKEFNKKYKNLLFYLPFIILSLLNIIVSLQNIFGLYQIGFLRNENLIFYFYKGISLLTVIFQVVIILLSYRIITHIKTGSYNRWLRFVWLFSSLILVFGVVMEGFRLVYGPKPPLTWLWVCIAVFIYWLVYKGLYRFKLSNEQYEIRELLKRNLSDDKIREIERGGISPHFGRLLQLLEKEKIYRNPDLSRDLVAEQLNISSGYLSQIISTSAKSNFPDFINSFRVKEVKEMMADPEFEKYNLLSIGLEAGFRSKTTFYSTFKKETGLTPAEYKKQIF